MKKIYFAVLLGAFVTPVGAATVNMGAGCDKCLQAASCGANNVFAELKKYSCAELIVKLGGADGNTYSKTVEAAAVKACASQYTPSDVYGDVVNAGALSAISFSFDVCHNRENGYYDTEENVMGMANETARAAVIEQCSQLGLCDRAPAGYYVHMCGLTPGQWGFTSYMDKCPDGGTSDAGCSQGLGCCYIPAGAFTDSTGSGEYSDKCYYRHDSEQESLEYFRCP